MTEKIKKALAEIAARINPAEIRTQVLSVQIRREILGWLEETGTTQLELADKANLRPETISRILNRDANLQLSTIAAIECAIDQTLIEVNEQHVYSKSLVVEPVQDDLIEAGTTISFYARDRHTITLDALSGNSVVFKEAYDVDFLMPDTEVKASKEKPLQPLMLLAA